MPYSLLNAILYLALLGLLCFPLGRLLAKLPFDAGCFPFRPFPMESKGKLYKKLRVQAWQKKAPDVSRWLPHVVPFKSVSGRLDGQTLDRMLRETCVAEVVHWLLCIAGITLFWIWPGAGGAVLFCLYVLLGNLPFIFIQRYERPRLLRMKRRLAKKECVEVTHERIDPEQ